MPSNGQMEKENRTQTVDFYSSLKRNTVLTRATPQVDRNYITVSKYALHVRTNTVRPHLREAPRAAGNRERVEQQLPWAGPGRGREQTVTA